MKYPLTIELITEKIEELEYDIRLNISYTLKEWISESEKKRLLMINAKHRSKIIDLNIELNTLKNE